jgi:hypothetical protein
MKKKEKIKGDQLRDKATDLAEDLDVEEFAKRVMVTVIPRPRPKETDDYDADTDEESIDDDLM